MTSNFTASKIYDLMTQCPELKWLCTFLKFYKLDKSHFECLSLKKYSSYIEQFYNAFGIMELSKMKIPGYSLNGNKVEFGQVEQDSNLLSLLNAVSLQLPSFTVALNKRQLSHIGNCHLNLYDCFDLPYPAEYKRGPTLNELLADFLPKFKNSGFVESNYIPDLEINSSVMHFKTSSAGSKFTVKDLKELSKDPSIGQMRVSGEVNIPIFYRYPDVDHGLLFFYLLKYPQLWNKHFDEFTCSIARVTQAGVTDEQHKVRIYERLMQYWSSEPQKSHFGISFERFLSEHSLDFSSASKLTVYEPLKFNPEGTKIPVYLRSFPTEKSLLELADASVNVPWQTASAKELSFLLKQGQLDGNDKSLVDPRVMNSRLFLMPHDRQNHQLCDVIVLSESDLLQIDDIIAEQKKMLQPEIVLLDEDEIKMLEEMDLMQKEIELQNQEDALPVQEDVILMIEDNVKLVYESDKEVFTPARLMVEDNAYLAYESEEEVFTPAELMLKGITNMQITEFKIPSSGIILSDDEAIVHEDSSQNVCENAADLQDKPFISAEEVQSPMQEEHIASAEETFSQAQESQSEVQEDANSLMSKEAVDPDEAILNMSYEEAVKLYGLAGSKEDQMKQFEAYENRKTDESTERSELDTDYSEVEMTRQQVQDEYNAIRSKANLPPVTFSEPNSDASGNVKTPYRPPRTLLSELNIDPNRGRGREKVQKHKRGCRKYSAAGRKQGDNFKSIYSSSESDSVAKRLQNEAHKKIQKDTIDYALRYQKSFQGKTVDCTDTSDTTEGRVVINKCVDFLAQYEVKQSFSGADDLQQTGSKIAEEVDLILQKAEEYMSKPQPERFNPTVAGVKQYTEFTKLLKKHKLTARQRQIIESRMQTSLPFENFSNMCYAVSLNRILFPLGITCIDLFKDARQHDLHEYWLNLVQKFKLYDFVGIMVTHFLCQGCKGSSFVWDPVYAISSQQYFHEGGELDKMCSLCNVLTKSKYSYKFIMPTFSLWYNTELFQQKIDNPNAHIRSSKAMKYKGKALGGIRYEGNGLTGHYDTGNPWNYAVVTVNESDDNENLMPTELFRLSQEMNLTVLEAAKKIQVLANYWTVEANDAGNFIHDSSKSQEIDQGSKENVPVNAERLDLNFFHELEKCPGFAVENATLPTSSRLKSYVDRLRAPENVTLVPEETSMNVIKPTIGAKVRLSVADIVKNSMLAQQSLNVKNNDDAVLSDNDFDFSD